MSALALIGLSVGGSRSGLVGGSGRSHVTRAKVTEQPAAPDQGPVSARQSRVQVRT